MDKKISLSEVAKVFLIIGTIGFGGAGTIIALTQEYCVNERKWLTQDEFIHGVALGQILGPFAVNSTIFVGYRARGFKGAIAALIAFLLPSVICVMIFTAFYLHFEKVPSLQSALKGISPVVIALILSVALQMSKNKIKSVEPTLLFLITLFLSVVLKFQVIEILLIALIYGFIKTKFFSKEDENEDA